MCNIFLKFIDTGQSLEYVENVEIPMSLYDGNFYTFFINGITQ